MLTRTRHIKRSRAAGLHSWLGQGLGFNCTACGRCCRGGADRRVEVRREFGHCWAGPNDALGPAKNSVCGLAPGWPTSARFFRLRLKDFSSALTAPQAVTHAHTWQVSQQEAAAISNTLGIELEDFTAQYVQVQHLLVL